MPPAPAAVGDDARPGSSERICPDCGGSGRKDGQACITCRGSGKINTRIGGG